MPCSLSSSVGRFVARVVLAACAVSTLGASEAADHAAARRALLEEIQRDAAATADSTGRSRFSTRVLAAMDAVPRHEFVPRRQAANAYANRPLPIGHGQTISQPYIVALMTELLDPEPGDVVLEVGTGSGYQAAVLAKIVARVKTIEIIEPLATSASKRLAALRFGNVEVKLGDGYFGWDEHAPYDGIVVTAAATSIPPPLVRQLKPGGRMVIPLGAPFLTQDLILVTKGADGKVSTRSVLPVAFVPLTGER
jgi:protein-L-isoaspartate(D-aspartate) O-methyltransferase